MQYAARRFVHKLYELVADGRSNTFFHISEVGVAVGGHRYVYVDALCRIAGNGGVACAVDCAVEGEVGRFLGVHYQHVVDVELEAVFQVLEVLVVQVTVGSSLMPLRVEDAVVAEGQSAGLDEYAVFQGEGGVEHIHFNGSVAEYTPFHGQRFEFAVEMDMAAGTPVEFGSDALHVMMDEFQVGAVGFNLQVE